MLTAEVEGGLSQTPLRSFICTLRFSKLKRSFLPSSGVTSTFSMVAITGTSLAYLTDKDDQVNTFTSGKVDITLDESKVELDADGYLSGYNGTPSDDHSYGKMYPGQVITKDPTITVTADSEKA